MKNSDSKSGLRPLEVIGFLFAQRKSAPFATFAMLFLQAVFMILGGIIAPIFVAKLLAQISAGDASLASSSHLLMYYALTLIGSDIIFARLSLIFTYLGETKMQKVLAQQMFNKITDKDMDFHANNMSGEIIANSTKLNNNLENFWDFLVFTITPIVTIFLSVTVALAIILWQYAVIVAVLFIVFAIFIAKAQASITSFSRKSATNQSKITAHFADVVTNISAMKAFARKKQENIRYQKTIDKWHGSVMKEMWRVTKVTTEFSIITAFMNVLAFVVAIVASEKRSLI